MRIPVAGWYPPSGPCIEGCGISADVPVTMTSNIIAAGRDERKRKSNPIYLEPGKHDEVREWQMETREHVHRG